MACCLHTIQCSQLQWTPGTNITAHNQLNSTYCVESISANPKTHRSPNSLVGKQQAIPEPMAHVVRSQCRGESVYNVLEIDSLWWGTWIVCGCHNMCEINSTIRFADCLNHFSMGAKQSSCELFYSDNALTAKWSVILWEGGGIKDC